MTGFDAGARGSGALDLYLTEIGRHPVLARDEERRLARRARDGDRAARERLVTANLRFVVTVAKRYRGMGLPFEDLINEGNVGLIRAAERFDEERGVRFVTYAVWWIRQSILAALAGAAGGTVPPGSGRPRRPGTGRRDAGRSRGPRMLSLEVSAVGEGGAPLAARLPDPRRTDPDRAVQSRALRRTLEEGMAFLPDREERVLRKYYGLDDERPRSLTGIAREMDVSRERVRQMRSRALARLRRGPHGATLAAFAR